jgi:predicted dehydrogenase
MTNWGIIGLGNMAFQFANAIKEIENVNLVAVSSNSKSNLNNFYKTFNLERKNLFNNYEDILNCKDLDAVYISTLNNSHLNLIKLLNKSNLNILCEKPLVMNYNEALEVSKNINSEEKNVFEAIAYRSHPQTKKIIDIINHEEIGKIKKITSFFGFKVRKIKSKSRLFNKEVGGGVLLDLGCYPISFVRLFLNKDSNFKINNVIGNYCKTGVEDHAELYGSINENVEIELKVSFQENLGNFCKIYGTEGYIIIPSPWLPEKKAYLEVFKKNSYYKVFTICESSIYANQIKIITEKFRSKSKKKDYLVNIDESVEISKILSEWKKLI